MGTRDEKEQFDTDTRRLLRDVEVPADDPAFSLEAILSEYGRGLIPPDDGPEELPDEPETVPPPRAREETDRPSAAPVKEPAPEPEMQKREETPEIPGIPRPPRPVSME